jgi:hypothetical protein
MGGPARSTVYQEVASAIGRESARKLIEKFGGTNLFIPKTIGARHPIAQALGTETARQLSELFHGTELNLPVSASRRRAVRKLAQQPGMTRQRIALETGYSERQVYRIIGEDADVGQGDLFGKDGHSELGSE